MGLLGSQAVHCDFLTIKDTPPPVAAIKEARHDQEARRVGDAGTRTSSRRSLPAALGIWEGYMVKSFVAYYEPGPNWLKGMPMKDQPLKAHVEYMVALHDRERLTMGGPFADDSGALVIFTAESDLPPGLVPKFMLETTKNSPLEPAPGSWASVE